MVNKYSTYIFDLDGTIYRGNKLLPGAKETLNYLIAEKKQIIFVSNKTTERAKDYARFLINNGINISINSVLNSSMVIIDYLKSFCPSCKFFALGENSFIEELSEAGFNYSENPSDIDVVIVTLDRTLNYDKLEIASKALESGAHFFAANIDNTCPVESGEILDAGSIISALEKRTGKKLENHFGKPSKFMMNSIKKNIDFQNHDCVIIGDRIETDIAMGTKFGIDTALVTTGVKFDNNLSEEFKPTYIISSIYEIIETKKKIVNI